MQKRFLFLALNFIFAFGILFASIFRSTSADFVFSQSPSNIDAIIPHVEYDLPGTGVVGPEDALWVLEAARDKVILSATLDNVSKAEILLTLGDKRLAYAEQMASRGQVEESISVIKKAVMYHEESLNYLRLASEKGHKPLSLVERLSSASLKDREVIENIYFMSQGEDRPRVSHINDSAKLVYDKSSQLLLELGSTPITSPFTN